VLGGIGMTSQGTRQRLLQRLRDKGIRDERVLEAMAATPRHLFVDEALSSRAYEDTALPIGRGQTISQPIRVAMMTAAVLGKERLGKVLEMGTGSGYQAAILAQLADKVFTTERIGELQRSARQRFHRLGLHNIYTRHADGNEGWPSQAPFDAIVVTAGGRIPDVLYDQLADGGVLVAPEDAGLHQQLIRVTRRGDQLRAREPGCGQLRAVARGPGISVRAGALIMFRGLYDRVLIASRHRHARRYLFALSLTEATVFPVPPDVMLAPMVLADRQSAWRLAFLTTAASVLGGLIGYLIGLVGHRGGDAVDRAGRIRGCLHRRGRCL
jgi:protein-L-isoaspartate(D-aspartate) O-methyltransferase